MATKTIITDNEVLLLQRDHDVLHNFVNNLQGMKVNDQENLERLRHELRKATIIDVEDFPPDYVRIHSKVTIKDVATGKEMVLTIVMPNKADMKQRHISVLAPLGTALIGFKKNRQFDWQVPAGTKTYQIIDVDNSLPPL